MKKAGEGSGGKVYKCIKKDSTEGVDKYYALKFVDKISAKNKQMLINEASLIAWMNIEHVVKFEALYEYKKRLWLIIEYMDGGSMSEICEEYH